MMQSAQRRSVNGACLGFPVARRGRGQSRTSFLSRAHSRDDLQPISPILIPTASALDQPCSNCRLAHEGATGGVPCCRYGEEYVGGICEQGMGVSVSGRDRSSRADEIGSGTRKGADSRRQAGGGQRAHSPKSTTLPISSVIPLLAYLHTSRRKSEMTSTTVLPYGNGGRRGSGIPLRRVEGERRSLNHSHLRRRAGGGARGDRRTTGEGGHGDK